MGDELQVGDVIRKDDNYRVIVDVRESGYSWRYCDIPLLTEEEVESKTYLSENSTDPFFVWGWKKIGWIPVFAPCEECGLPFSICNEILPGATIRPESDVAKTFGIDWLERVRREVK